MSTPRVWIYSRLTEFVPLTELIGVDNPRVFAKKTMTSNVEECPYIVYKLGFAANEDIAEEMPEGKDAFRQFVQIFVYDYQDSETGDYTKIDAVLTQIKAAIHGQSSAAHGVMAAKYIETSQDLNDETMNAVMKYARIQMTTKET